MTKVVYCRDFGSFDLSTEAQKKLLEMGSPYVQKHISERDYKVELINGKPVKTPIVYYELGNIPRHDPLLLQVAEEIISKDPETDLAIKEIPGPLYWIQEWDGYERIWTPEIIPWIDASK